MTDKEKGTTTITTFAAHYLKPGQTISITEPDLRWWKRLIHFVLFKSPPIKKKFMTVVSVDSETTITVKYGRVA